jgi:putative MATE family efflux protein
MPRAGVTCRLPAATATRGIDAETARDDAGARRGGALAARGGVRYDGSTMEGSPLPAATASIYVDDPGRRGVVEPVLLKRILLLGLPVIIGMLTQTLINQIDEAFIGRLPESEAVPGQAAMMPSLILLWAFGGFLSAISVGTQALTARRFGESDLAGAGKVLTNSAVIAAVSSVVATLVSIAVVGGLFPLLHHDPAVQSIGISFCRIRFLGIVPMVLMSSFKSFYDGIGRTHVHMAVAFMMNVLNFALCWLLVFGNLGFPRLGVDGAAWAAVLSASVGYLVMLGWSLRREDRLRFGVFVVGNLDRAVAWSITKLSVFSGLATVFVMTGFMLFLKIPALVDEQTHTRGTNGAAASNIIIIMMAVFMTCLAFGTSTATLVAQSLGAKKPGLAMRYGWQSALLAVVVMSLLGGLVYAFPEPILRWFVSNDGGEVEALKDAVVAIAVPSLRFCGFIAPLAAAALVLTQALYGAGESRFVAIVEFTLHFFCLVPVAYVLAMPLGFGLLGCWYATALYAALLLVATAWRFASGRWQHAQL